MVWSCHVAHLRFGRRSSVSVAANGQLPMLVSCDPSRVVWQRSSQEDRALLVRAPRLDRAGVGRCVGVGGKSTVAECVVVVVLCVVVVVVAMVSAVLELCYA